MMIKETSRSVWIVRIAIILFWVTAFYGVLQLSNWSSFFQKERSICMYTWSDRVDEDLLKEFEERTGIHVYMNYYDSNEELITKLEIMPTVDCDIMLPSGYIIEDLIEADLLKKIDRSRCDFFDDLYPELMNKFYDPESAYSLPLYWDVMTIGYSAKKFPTGLPSKSWGMIFEKDQVPCKKIGMINDAREIISLETRYFNYAKKDITKETIKKMRQVASKQKQWVGVYCDAQQGYFLSTESYYLAVSQREYIARSMQESDFVRCMIPEEGSLLTIDNIVISASTQKEDLVYEFLNFLYSYEVLSHCAREFCFLPASKSVFEELESKYIGIEGLHPRILKKKNIRVFKNLLTLKETNEFWIRVKSS
jgi:spermidine/putrescine transport system substrate-binding protein